MKPRLRLSPWIIALGLLCTAGANAQVAPPPLPPAAFDMTGFIQEATVAKQGTGQNSQANPHLYGGTLTINGIKMIVPDNTIVQMPAFALSWADLFNNTMPELQPVNSFNSANLATGTQTGLALADTPPPFPSFEVRAVGNIRTDLPGHVGETVYIVGGLIVPITQQGLNAGFGVINFIDYAHGRFRVGGKINFNASGVPINQLDASNPGALVEINDPVGRWGLAHSPDPRFTTDTSNPTVFAATGYPVCVPRVDPAVADDVLCPRGNRPLNGDTRFPRDPFLATGAPLKTFTMPAPATGVFPDARQQVPLKVGDSVDYAGTLYKLEPGDPNYNGNLPASSPANMYISAHTLEADLGIFTAPGKTPCYVRVEALVMPTALVRNAPTVTGGSPATAIPLENSTAVHIVGFTTDPSRIVDLKAIDVNPLSGVETERTFASVLPETLAPGLVRGRFRFQVSRTTGTSPATREYIAKSRTGQVVAANGLTTGQYRLPCFDFLFAEHTVFGNPTIPNHFNLLPFLASGSGPYIPLDGSTGGLIGRLDPWPGP